MRWTFTYKLSQSVQKSTSFGVHWRWHALPVYMLTKRLICVSYFEKGKGALGETQRKYYKKDEAHGHIWTADLAEMLPERYFRFRWVPLSQVQISTLLSLKTVCRFDFGAYRWLPKGQNFC